MNLQIMTDLEGVAGVYSFEEQTYPGDARTDQAKRWLTAEVNAAVDGALAAGTEDVLVIDGHGSGAIWFEALHPAARLLHGQGQVIAWTNGIAFRDIDAAAIVGQHAMEGTVDGPLSHTQSSRNIDSWKLNGEPVGEIAEWALCAGAFGVPMIFLSGDDAACREAEALIPGITTAAVKQGTARQGAMSVSRKRAGDLIREGMKRAVEKHRADPLRPLVRPGPYRAEIRYRTTDLADAAERTGAVRVDEKTIARESDSIVKALYG